VDVYLYIYLLTAVLAGLLVVAKIAIVQASCTSRLQKRRGRPAVTVTQSVGRRVGIALTSSSLITKEWPATPTTRKRNPTQQNHGFRRSRVSGEWRGALIHTDGPDSRAPPPQKKTTGEWLAPVGNTESA